mmetsp:Transcript_16060/g.26940  ORF Transcript_16060/g.26940 Transcript_16060/m.26940 type:complete len:217 (+) Transcript_16060:90-740(+)
MGSGVAKNIPAELRVEKEDVDETIDVDTLYSALYKLTPVFEINETLVLGLTSEVIDAKHCSFDEKFLAVEDWVERYCDTYLTPPEIFHLIKYIELYHYPRAVSVSSPPPPPPLPTDPERTLDSPGTEGNLHSFMNAINDEPSDEAAETGSLSLMCPFMSDFASWSAEIRSVELEKSISERSSVGIDDSLRLSLQGDNFTMMGRRGRGNSDMSDITI